MITSARGGRWLFFIRTRAGRWLAPARGRARSKRLAGVALALAAWPAGAKTAPSVALDAPSGRVTLVSGRLELTIDTRHGLNPLGLRDLRSGRMYSDLDYKWPGGQRPRLDSAPTIVVEAGAASASFRGTLGPLEVVQTFSASGPDALTERIELRNPTAQPLDTSSFACGFVKRLADESGPSPAAASAHFCNIPYRRHPETGELCDYTAEELLSRQSWYSAARSPIYDRRMSSVWGAEGWAWYQGGTVLLVAKYNSDAMEWSLLAPQRGGGRAALRFGGAGRWKLGDPEGAARLGPHGSFRFGETRYQVLDGDWRQAYSAFRTYTEAKGNRIPPAYNPPVHWNELYDNPLWGGKDGDQGDTPARRQAFYRREDMAIEAAKARELGCQCLYLDPGWDTEFGSSIWAADRLGSETSFVRWLQDTYGLALALHTPLAPWNKSSTYPAEARRMNEDGRRADEGTGNISDLCLASQAYLDTKVGRLRTLCRDGAYFLMFDGSWYPGPCWDPAHGHAVPLTRQEHLDAVLQIERRVHEAFPKAVIEQHDPMLGPGTPRYVPTYFLHDKAGGFDELWGNEYMIEPLDDIITRRAFSLFYLDLAYDIPVYLHIRLNRDNANALMFWWYASTCRHLGMGAKPAEPAVWEAQKSAMRQYLALKRFYAQGLFYGLDETVHAHTLPDLGESVLDCFNLEDHPVHRTLRFRCADIGLPPKALRAEGAHLSDASDLLAVDVDVAPRGHTLVRLRPAD
jgi:hypothetical protein